jgi:hypothetical protein
MELKRGIFLHTQALEGYDAIRINSGAVFHAKQTAAPVNFQGFSYTPQYEEDAWVAKRDWRALNPEEIKKLESNGNRNDYNTVYLGDIPENIKEHFELTGISGSKSREEVLERLASDPVRTSALNASLNEFLGSISGDKPFHFHCIGSNFPNIEMVACNTTRLPPGFKPTDIRYMGMHNDGTAQMTIYTAHRFGNRISINLGKDARAFLFVNLSMVQAINMLKKKMDIKKHPVSIANIPGYFFKHFPDYPIIRVRQKPYQYYIAPTDNIFHDGSTLGNTALDITMSYFGGFTY